MSRRYWSSEPSSYEDFFVTGGMRTTGTGTRLGRVRVRRGTATETTYLKKHTARQDEPIAPGLRSIVVQLVDALAQAIPPDPGEPRESMCRVGSVAVVDDEGTTLHERVGEEAPVPAVARGVPVVTKQD